MLVRACKDMRASGESFTTYGPKDKIGFFDEGEMSVSFMWVGLKLAIVFDSL